MSEAILDARNLTLYYRTSRGIVKAVDEITFKVKRGETLAFVGESGSGKSSTAFAIIRVLPRNVSKHDGTILFEGSDIMKLDEEEFRKKIRWKSISMVFQGALNSLNPVVKVGDQIADPLVVHLGMDQKEAIKMAEEEVEKVGLPRYIVQRYPHELSGGMKQRVIIAMALIMRPKLVILDEPTSALDVMTQGNIMNLLKDLKRENKLSYIFITHDLSLASELADSVGIMYGGRLMELGPADTIFVEPKHPYTQKLLASTPTLRIDRMPEFIPGTPPDLIRPPPGCRFHPRCPFAKDICKKKEPEFIKIGDEHYVACWLYE
jgi:peptide/nickel transport system ATP-binding protein